MITAKEIVDMAIEQSEGRWKPSPGYVYPMIWKLLDKGLISEVDNGRYSLTRKGIKLLSDIDWVFNLLEKKEYVVSRIKNTGSVLITSLTPF
jgi:DNA-binding PadR family transcriptional regulator